MTTHKYDLMIPEIPYRGNRVVLEYVFVNHTGFELCSKTRVVEKEPKSVEECPMWDNYMWNDVRGRLEDLKDMILKPVAMFENPFYKSPHKLVLCEFWITKDQPAAINTRQTCKKTMEKLDYDQATGYRPKQPFEPWFGIEQEYFVTAEDGIPISYEPDKFDYESLVLVTKIGHQHAKNVGIERELSNRHLMACLYAGVDIGGNIRENDASQWEYQIGPCSGVSIGDHLNMSRYILHRLAEMFGLRVTLHPVPVHESPFTSSGHLNFSTSQMRAKGGIKFIRHAIDMLSKSDEDALLKMYDPTLTQENKERLTNTSSPWHPQLHKFIYDATNKAKSSVRIPPLVIVNECGYLEDRRPSSTIDPYAAAEGIVKACIFGDFLNPGFESLKDVSFWDSNP
ncbi:glutamine synthetase-like [Mytilus californianus]|uniref:glutamine synthetase-like n=1 Tax=Mytilus californianus TaxID=6549 RepID=UPI0022454945|nr:glutamine synthetase-like [Mytilus californianus]